MYTYKCEKCGKEFEYKTRHEDMVHPFIKNDDGTQKECGGKLYRVYQPTYVVIKGVR